MVEDTQQADEKEKRSPAPGYGRVKLRKRKAIWHARYPLPDGSRISESTELTNKERALDWAKDMNDRLERGEIPTKTILVERRDRTFDALADAFMREYRGWSEGTRRSTASTVKKLTARFGDTPLADITTAGLSRYLSDRVRDGLNATSSYNRYRSCLSAMFAWAKIQGWADQNPAAGLKTAKEDEKDPHPYSDDELARLLASLPERARRVAIVAVTTGCRAGELKGLHWRHIRLDDNRIRIEHTKAYLDRTISLRPEARQVFEDMRRERLGPVNTLKAARALDDEPVFGPSAYILKKIKAAAEECGISDATQHRLRDTFGTRCFDARTPAQEVQRLMGHKSIDMTMRYARVSDARLVQAIESMPPLPEIAS